MPRPGTQNRAEDLVDRAQTLLATTWEAPVRLRIHDVIRDWGRHTVLRCRVKDGPEPLPDFLIVKAADQPDRGVADERAGLQLLAELPAVRHLVPRLYATDPVDDMLVLEDVGNGPSLGQLLQARAAWAEDGLRESMRGLAAVHAATRGRHARYGTLRAAGAAGSPPAGDDPASRPYGHPELTATLATALDQVGLDPAAVPTAELEDVSIRMSPAAEVRCLTFHDQCPSNRTSSTTGSASSTWSRWRSGTRSWTGPIR